MMNVAHPRYNNALVVIFINELLKNVVTLISCITITVRLTISITTALWSASDTNCSITAPRLCLLQTHYWCY